LFLRHYSLDVVSHAEQEGFHYEETLTGFKWMGNKAHELSQAPHNKKVLFAFEEAIGFMCDDICRDKDGVRAAAVIGELYTYLRQQQPPSTMAQHLDALYAKYGFFATQNRYFFCYDPTVLRQIFQEIRAEGKYATKCGEFEIIGVRDLTTPGCDRRPEAQRAYSPSLPVSSSTEMITFYFANGGIATLRGSGTEPKLKYYVGACQSSCTLLLRLTRIQS
jgi:phosphomannomutase